MKCSNLMVGRSGRAENATLVCDNLNAHVTSAFDEAFARPKQLAPLWIGLTYYSSRKAWQLAQHRQELTKLNNTERDARSSLCLDRIDPRATIGLGSIDQLASARRRLAIHG
tara:strand:- start:1035 stop:1370 length:336 start_codon:yes stop_codon:yes gene_type:complete